jgi:predicted kinase
VPISSPALVLACGHAACLKTTATLLAAPRLAMNIVATYGMGSFDRSSDAALARDRAVRYARLFAVVETLLEHGLGVWVDGNFPTPELRQRLWTLARIHGVREVVVVQCVCSDEEILRERFASRRADPRQPDGAADDLSAYHGSVRQFQEIGAEELAGFPETEVLLYDSCRRTIAPDRARSKLGIDVLHALSDSGLLPPAGPRAASNAGR